MTSTVTYLHNFVDTALIERLFAKFSSRYGSLWTSRLRSDQDWIYCLEDWLEELSCFSVDIFKKGANKALSIYKEFPPTLGQLVELCLRESGIPSQDDIINLMVKRDFCHPIVKMVFAQVGSWAVANDKPEQLKNKVKSHYDDCLTLYRSNPATAWESLEQYKTQKALEAPPEPKIASDEERKRFKERMAEYMELANSQKMKLGTQEHPTWPKEQITKSSKFYDATVYAEYKKYLLEVEEVLSLTFPPEYAYDRVRFLREIEVIEHLKKVGYTGKPRIDEKVESRGANGPQKMYKSWCRD